MITNSTNINKTNNYLSTQIIEHKKIAIYEDENPDPDLEQAQMSGVDKPVNWISTRPS